MKNHQSVCGLTAQGLQAFVIPVLLLSLALASSALAQPAANATEGLTLEEAVRLALGNSEFLKQVEAEIEGARGSVVASKSGQLPQIALSGKYARNLKLPSFFLPAEMGDAFGVSGPIPMGSDNDLTAAVSVTYNLWTAGRLSAQVGAASEMLAATQSQERAVADGVLFSTIVAYHDVLLAEENLKTAEKSLAAAKESERVAQSGFEQGTLSNFDHLRSRVEVANRQAPLIAARNDLAQKLLVLERRCGLAPATISMLADSLGGVQIPTDQNSAVAQMLQNSSEIQALQHAVAAARQGVILRKAGNKPMLQLSGSYAFQGQWDNGLVPGDNEMATSSNVALGLSFPIFDGKMTSGLVAQASADLRIAELELARITREKELSVRQAWLSLANALAALDGRTEAVALAEEAHRLALVRVANGLATPLEQLDAELALTVAREQQSSVRYACNIAEAGLALAIGNASTPYLDTINPQELDNE